MKKKRPTKLEKNGLYIAICCCAVIIAAIGYVGNREGNINNMEKYDIVNNNASDVVDNEYPYDDQNEYLSDDIVLNEGKTEVIDGNTTKSNSINETDSFKEPEVAASKTAKIEELVFAMPVEGNVVVEFSEDELIYNETLSDWRTHNGIDISCDKDAAVYSSANGKVVDIYDDALGKNVVIEHINGYKSVYANLSEQIEVSVGDEVKSGGIIGKVGQSAVADFATGAHLHFEIVENGEYVDPCELLE